MNTIHKGKGKTKVDETGLQAKLDINDEGK